MKYQEKQLIGGLKEIYNKLIMKRKTYIPGST